MLFYAVLYACRAMPLHYIALRRSSGDVLVWRMRANTDGPCLQLDSGTVQMGGVQVVEKGITITVKTKADANASL